MFWVAGLIPAPLRTSLSFLTFFPPGCYLALRQSFLGDVETAAGGAAGGRPALRGLKKKMTRQEEA